MKASDFIGMRVLDGEAHEIGKVAELSIKLKNVWWNTYSYPRAVL